MGLSPETRFEDMIEESVSIRHKIEVSRSIVANNLSADPGLGDVARKWVIEALEKEIPVLERRVTQLDGYIGTERDRRRS